MSNAGLFLTQNEPEGTGARMPGLEASVRKGEHLNLEQIRTFLVASEKAARAC